MLNYNSKKEKQNGHVKTELKYWLIIFTETHGKTAIIFNKTRGLPINIRAWIFPVLREKENSH